VPNTNIILLFRENLFSISIYQGKLLSELRDQIDGSDTSSYSQKFYSGKGSIAAEGNIRSGRAEGLWNYYYESGKTKRSVKYSGGFKNGKYKEFGPNGKITIEGYYSNDSANGKWNEYDSLGVLTEQYEYKKGERTDKEIKLNRGERIKNSMNDFHISESDLKGTVCFYNPEKKDTVRNVLSGERISIIRKSGMPEISDGFLKAVKDSDLYVSNRNVLGLETDFIKIPVSDIQEIGFPKTIQFNPVPGTYSPTEYRMFKVNDTGYKIVYFPSGKHKTNFNDTE
jgi:hypothetical protein